MCICTCVCVCVYETQIYTRSKLLLIPLTFPHLPRELLQLPTLPIGVLNLLQLLKSISATNSHIKIRIITKIKLSFSRLNQNQANQMP